MNEEEKKAASVENTDAEKASRAKASPKDAEAAAKAEPVKAPRAKAASKDADAPEKAEPVKAPKARAAPKDDEAAEKTDAEKVPEKNEAQAVLSAGGPDVSASGAASDDKSSRGRKGRVKSVPAGIAFIKATFNNTIVSIADARGGVISWSSAGKAGFKGSRKSTAFAATMVAQDAARQAYAKGMHEVEVRLHGAGSGRESAVRAIQNVGIQVSVIRDCTAIPHNGCRARKRRRV